MQPQTKRSRFFLNRHVQIMIMYYVFVASSLILITAALVLSYFLQSIQDQLLNSSVNQPGEFFKLFENIKFFWFAVFGLCLFVIIILTTASVMISQKLVGPIYSLNNSLIKMKSEKKLSKIRFRKNDYFKEIENSFNEMVEEVEKK